MKILNKFFIVSILILDSYFVISKDNNSIGIDDNFIDIVKPAVGFVKYDEQEKLKEVESLPLEQPGGDSIDSVAFNFEDIDLKNVAEYMERVHKVKFILDEIVDTNKGGQKLSGNKISFRTNVPLSKKESWNLFITFLSMAGLDVVPMSHAGFYRIVPLPGAPQEAIPTYIGASPAILPDNDMVIRYVYFMQNADPVKIQTLISKFQSSSGSLSIYKDLKALIFTDKSYNIKSLMTIVKELDKPIAPQVMSVVKLQRANVEDVINLYNSLRPSQTQQQRAWSPDNKNSPSEFWSQNVVLSGDKRTNTLIVLGPKDAVARIEEFVLKYVDVESEDKQAPVFVYYLEYTNATEIQKTLSSVVSYGSNTTPGQYGGVRDGKKYLPPMSIVADTHSNSLIVNASPGDYVAVEKLIKELDVPQKQVAIEILIVSVSSIKQKQLGAQISGPNNDNTFLRNVSAQTSGVPPGTGIVTTSSPNVNGVAESIKSSLSSLLVRGVGEVGSTILTFGKPIWALFKILNTITSTKIIQNPFIVVTNNSKGLLKIGTSRRIITGKATSGGTDSTTGYQTAEANLAVTIVPQINDKKMISLSIAIDNNEFINPGVHDAVQDQKTITTMATIADGEVLVLGGIMGEITSSASTGVPFVSKIPIFGHLFKSKSDQDQKTMYMIFICPKELNNITSQKDVQLYTRTKIEEAQDYLRLMEDIEDFESKQDPLDRAFFGDKRNNSDDLTPHRILDRSEMVSYHEPVAKKSPFKKKSGSSRRTKKSKKETKEDQNNKIKKDLVDMSENVIKDSPSVSSIKNMVQKSQGDLE